MNIKQIRAYLMVCSLLVVFQPLPERSQRNSDAAKTSAQHSATEHDGQHDFDFEIGTWKIHLKRLDHRLVGSTNWIEFDGTSVTRKVWDGRANLEEFETDSPAGGHIEGLTLRLYDPQTHQWSLYWATSKSGAMARPPSANSRMGAASFSTRNQLALMAEQSWFDLFGRTPPPIRPTLNSHSRMMEARPGKSIGSPIRRECKMNLTKRTEFQGISRSYPYFSPGMLPGSHLATAAWTRTAECRRFDR